jgi:hypothetical protein
VPVANFFTAEKLAAKAMAQPDEKKCVLYIIIYASSASPMSGSLVLNSFRGATEED